MGREVNKICNLSRISAKKRMDSDETSKSKQDLFPDAQLVPEELVRTAITNFLKFPYRLTQIGGYNPYSVTKEGELKLSPVFLFVSLLTFVTHWVITLIFILFQSFFVTIVDIDKFSNTEKQSTIISCLVGMIGQTVIRIVLCKNCSGQKRYHLTLVKIFCELVLGNKEGGIRNQENSIMYLTWTKDHARSLNQWCWTFVIGIFLNMLIMLSPFAFVDTNMIFETWISIFFGVSAIIYSVTILLLNSIALQWICYVLLIQICFRVIQHQSETASKRRAATLIEYVEKLEKLVDEFNHEFYMIIVIWFILTMALMVHQIFTAVGYIRIELYGIIFAIMPTVWCGWGTSFYICNVCSNFTIQAKQSVESLCKNSLEVENSDDDDADKHGDSETISNSKFISKIQFLYSRWQASPCQCQITPGGYFHLNRRTVTSIAGLLTTYIIVLVQFNGNEKPGWAGIWNITKEHAN